MGLSVIQLATIALVIGLYLFLRRRRSGAPAIGFATAKCPPPERDLYAGGGARLASGASVAPSGRSAGRVAAAAAGLGLAGVLVAGVFGVGAAQQALMSLVVAAAMLIVIEALALIGVRPAGVRQPTLRILEAIAAPRASAKRLLADGPSVADGYALMAAALAMGLAPTAIAAAFTEAFLFYERPIAFISVSVLEVATRLVVQLVLFASVIIWLARIFGQTAQRAEIYALTGWLLVVGTIISALLEPARFIFLNTYPIQPIIVAFAFINLGIISAYYAIFIQEAGAIRSLVRAFVVATALLFVANTITGLVFAFILRGLF